MNKKKSSNKGLSSKFNSKTRPLISIIIPNWNGSHNLKKCLESLARLEYPNYEIIVVDNGSTDGSPAMIRKKFPFVKCIENQTNLGFSKGCNIAYRHSKGKYIFILNNDVVIDSRNLLEVMVNISEEKPDIGVVGPMVYHYGNPSKIQFGGPTKDISGGMDISGCAFLIRRDVIKKIGLFDPIYFAYYEDRDFFKRAKNSGYKLHFVSDVSIFHKGGETSRKYPYFRLYLATRNLSIFATRNLSRGHAVIAIFFSYFLYFPLVLLKCLVNNNIDAVKGIIRGIFDGLAFSIGSFRGLEEWERWLLTRMSD